MSDEVALNVKFTGDSSGVVTESRRAKDAVDDLGAGVGRNTERTKQFSTANRDAQNALNNLGGTVRVVTGLLGALGAVTVVAKFKDVAVETAKLQGQLKTMTGSVEAASKAWADLEKFASKTPFTLDQSVQAFVRMKSLGLDPTERALTAFGNTASAMGRDLTQMIEAVADASTNEFERLKEFGIKAKQQGEEVTFTFQGVSTTVGKNSQEIVEYLTSIGEVTFAGAMADQMSALPGLFSNLEDSVDGLFRAVGELGGNDLLAGFVRGMTEEVNDLKGALPGVIDNAELLTDALVTMGAVMVSTLIPSFTALATTMASSVTFMGIATTAATTLRAALAFLGGPVGIALIAGTALLAFGNNAETAEGQTRRLKEEADKLNDALGDLSKGQIEQALVGLRQELAKTEAQIVSARQDAEDIRQTSRMGGLGMAASSTTGFAVASKDADRLAEAADLTRARIADLETQLVAMSKTAEVKVAPAVKAATTGIAELAKKARDQADAFNLANDPGLKFARTIEEIQRLQVSGLVTQTALNNAIQDAVDGYVKAVGATDEYAEAQKREKAAASEAEREATRAAEALARANAQAAERAAAAWNDFGRSVSESFRDTFVQAEGNLNDFLKRAEEALKEAARRWLFDSTIGRLFGGFTAAGAAGAAQAGVNSGGGGGGGGAGSLLGGNYSSLLTSGSMLTGANYAIAQGAGYVMRGLTAAGMTGANQSFINAYANTTTLGNSVYPGGGTVAGGLVTAGAGIAGSYVGNILGESVFNKKAESSYGSAAGSLAGAYIGAQYGSVGGPWGAAIGAIIGALADVAFGGDGKKRSNTGAIVGPTATGGTVAASGLRIAPYDRRGSDEGTQKLTSALIQIDEVLTGVARSAGVNVDFSNTALRGRNPDAGHDEEGIFFGGKGFNGGAEGFAEAPEMFIRAWIDEINEQLPKRVRDIIKGVDGTAEELVSGFAAAVEIDNLLGLDVVKDTKTAVDKLLEPQKLLIDLYDATTERVMSMAAGIDGSAAGLVTLSEALRDQKTAAVELALAYQGVQLETGAVFGGAIQSIRESLLTDEQLYETRRAQIAALTAELATTISPDQISRLQNEIVGLSSDTFRSLDSGQQQALGPEFIQFLTSAQNLAQQQLDAGLASLASREEGIRNTIDLELSAAQQQTQAAATMQTATEQFGQWVQELQNNPPNITINIPGFGNVTVPFGLNQLSEITF